MPRRILFLLLLLVLALSACKPTNQTRTAAAGTTQSPVATVGTSAAPKQAPTLSLPAEAQSVPGCTVVSFMPTPDTTSLFPPITADDWTRGPLTATVKIIEYSDFQ